MQPKQIQLDYIQQLKKTKETLMQKFYDLPGFDNNAFRGKNHPVYNKQQQILLYYINTKKSSYIQVADIVYHPETEEIIKKITNQEDKVKISEILTNNRLTTNDERYNSEEITNLLILLQKQTIYVLKQTENVEWEILSYPKSESKINSNDLYKCFLTTLLKSIDYSELDPFDCDKLDKTIKYLESDEKDSQVQQTLMFSEKDKLSRYINHINISFEDYENPKKIYIQNLDTFGNTILEIENFEKFVKNFMENAKNIIQQLEKYSNIKEEIITLCYFPQTIGTIFKIYNILNHAPTAFIYYDDKIEKEEQERKKLEEQKRKNLEAQKEFEEDFLNCD